MKALTLTQPWATLVALKEKRIETRSWNTHYHGPLAIHAAKNFPVDAKSLFYAPYFSGVLKSHGIEKPSYLPLGMIIATCELVATHRIDDMDWILGKRGWSQGSLFWKATDQEKAFGNYSVGRYMWFLENIVMLKEPIPAKGALGLWEWDQNNSYT